MDSWSIGWAEIEKGIFVTKRHIVLWSTAICFGSKVGLKFWRWDYVIKWVTISIYRMDIFINPISPDSGRTYLITLSNAVYPWVTTGEALGHSDRDPQDTSDQEITHQIAHNNLNPNYSTKSLLLLTTVNFSIITTLITLKLIFYMSNPDDVIINN